MKLFKKFNRNEKFCFISLIKKKGEIKIYDGLELAS